MENGEQGATPPIPRNKIGGDGKSRSLVFLKKRGAGQKTRCKTRRVTAFYAVLPASSRLRFYNFRYII
jgi:hypothetical protein